MVPSAGALSHVLVLATSGSHPTYRPCSTALTPSAMQRMHMENRPGRGREDYPHGLAPAGRGEHPLTRVGSDPCLCRALSPPSCVFVPLSDLCVSLQSSHPWGWYRYSRLAWQTLSVWDLGCVNDVKHVPSECRNRIFNRLNRAARRARLPTSLHQPAAQRRV